MKQKTYQKDQTQEVGVSMKSAVKPGKHKIFLQKKSVFWLVWGKIMLPLNKCRYCEKKNRDISITNTVNIVFGCSIRGLGTLSKGKVAICNYNKLNEFGLNGDPILEAE